MSYSPCNGSPGFAALPGAVGADKAPQILLFYNTQNSNLAVEQRKGTKGGHDASEFRFAALKDDQVGFLANPTQLGAAQLAAANVVVGFTKPATKTQPPTHKVTILSPVYQTIESTQEDNITVAVTSSDAVAGLPDQTPDAWIYFLKDDEDTSKQKQLYEYSFLNQEIKLIDSVSVAGGSSLAAFWDGSVRRVIYQRRASKGATTSYLYEYHPDPTSDNEITATVDAVVGTSLAVAYINKKTYLYYSITDGHIERVIKDETGKWEDKGSVIVKEDSKSISATSQMTVITSDGVNHLLYYNKKNQVEHITDKL